MNPSLALLRDNTMAFDVTGVRDPISGETIDSATVTVELLEKNGDPVQGVDWPATLDPINDAPGSYRILLPHTLAPVGRVRGEVIVNHGGRRATWRGEIDVLTRRLT